eukprot:1158454-Pelagomonas_calceolata.AAC.9
MEAYYTLRFLKTRGDRLKASVLIGAVFSRNSFLLEYACCLFCLMGLPSKVESFEASLLGSALSKDIFSFSAP